MDLQGLSEAYELREITEVLWIPSHENPADALTKQVDSEALRLLIEENRVINNPNAWIERTKKGELKAGYDTKKKSEKRFPRVSVQHVSTGSTKRHRTVRFNL